MKRANIWRMRDGIDLHLHTWPHDATVAPRGRVLIVHGIGEHGARYAHVAASLNRAGFDVIACDQYGHGRSPGKRGTLTHPLRLLDDLTDQVDHARADMPAGQPLILLGHSMGGALAAQFVALGLRPVEGLVLSSPALRSGMRGWQKALAGWLANYAPDWTIGNGLPIERISHDAAVVAAYRADPLCHDRVSGRLAQAVDGAGGPALAAAPDWRTPTLLLYAGDDHLVDAQGSRAFADSAPEAWVTSQAFPRHFHELFNEVERAPVFDALHAWLQARFPQPGRASSSP